MTINVAKAAVVATAVEISLDTVGQSQIESAAEDRQKSGRESPKRWPVYLPAQADPDGGGIGQQAALKCSLTTVLTVALHKIKGPMILLVYSEAMPKKNLAI